MTIQTKALLLVPLVVSVVITVFSALGYLVITIMGVPFSFGFALQV